MSPQTSLVGFCLLAYGHTWMCWLSIGLARAGSLELPVSDAFLATLGQFGPFAAAVVFTALDGGSGGLRRLLGRFLLWRVNPVWYGVVLLLPPALICSAKAAHALVEGTTVQAPSYGDASTLLPHFVFILLVGGPLGEELGWRGFALCRLRARWPSIPASALLGVIWAGWHLPLWWIADVPPSLGFYVVGTIALTYLFTWVWDHTQGSVLLAMLFHASLNTSLSRLDVRPAWIEWTALLWLVALAVGIVEWRRRRRTGCAAPLPLDNAADPIASADGTEKRETFFGRR